MRFLAGILTGVVLVGAGAGAYLLSGRFDPSAIRPPSAIEKRVAGLALERSVARRAGKATNPFASRPDVARGALDHYKEMCVFCHGAPGVDASEAGEGLNPPAPDLTVARIQSRTDAELFWIVQNGIRMTGMPAFGPTHKDEELWKMVSFLRHLPELSAEEQKALKGAETGEPAHHD